MALRFHPREREAGAVLDWERPARQRFIESHAYRVLSAIMARYVSGEHAGRCVLISGHRGAGKTSLVARVAQDLSEAIFDDWAGFAELLAPGAQTIAPPSKPLFRPLIVKLHGPSLIAQARAAAASGADAKAGGAKAPDEKDALARSALREVAISLYRAMAKEFSACFANQAASRRGFDADDRLYESAAQFGLDADTGLDPAAARDYWAAFGALRDGVLWPAKIADADQAANAGDRVPMRDRGVREIQAFVTASQVFRVCSGSLEAKETLTDAKALKSERERKFGLDFAKPLNALAAAALGGVAGLGLGYGAAGAAAGAALVGAASLTGSESRKRNQEAALNYTFIREFGLGALERDLPLVIERARAAGLAPVFVVDELDKVEHLESELEALLARLKHLTTDYAFFCFLTGSDYFELVEKRIDEVAYPREHSYFSERLFISYSPREVADYVNQVIAIERAPDTPLGDQQAEDLGKLMLARLIMHRSRLNTLDVVRALTRAEQGEMRGDPRAITSSFGNRLVVALQLAAEIAIESEGRGERLRVRPWLLQTAIDATYRLSREWARGADAFDDSAAGYAKAYMIRAGQTPDQYAERAVDTVIAQIGRRAFDEATAKSPFASLLTRFANLAETAKLHLPLEDLALVDAIPEELDSGLLARDPKSARYRILFDDRGRFVGGEESAREEAVAEAIARARGFRRHLAATQFDLSELAKAGLLPQTLPWRAIANVSALEDAGMEGGPADLARSALDDAPILLSFLAQMERIDEDLTRRLALLMRIRNRLGAAADQPDQGVVFWWRRIGRFVDAGDLNNLFEAGAIDSMPSFPDQSVTGPGWLPYATKLFAISPPPAEPALREARDRLWRAWAERIQRYLRAGGDEPDASQILDNLVLAAANRPPASLLRYRLDDMTTADWSRLVFSAADAIARKDESIPPWACAAGLAALGFPEPVLQGVAKAAGAQWLGGHPAPNALPPRAPKAGGGVIVVLKDEESWENEGSQPALVLARRDFSLYDLGLRWLRACGVYQKILDER